MYLLGIARCPEARGSAQVILASKDGHPRWRQVWTKRAGQLKRFVHIERFNHLGMPVGPKQGTPGHQPAPGARAQITWVDLVGEHAHQLTSRMIITVATLGAFGP